LHSRARSCYKNQVISPDDFRKVLSHFASGVTVITTCESDGRPTGLTASAFTSVSLDPPLILVCVAHKSQSYPALLERGRFAVNFLRSGQEDLSRRFATSGLDKFEGVPHRISALGLPVLTEALAHVECVTVNQHVEGDHTVFIGRVEHSDTSDAMPLLYFRGKYDRLGGS
jgi:flavin reductase (DIM6/NTAB) family NADH-FMN oxidoreductase RutF